MLRTDYSSQCQLVLRCNSVNFDIVSELKKFKLTNGIQTKDSISRREMNDDDERTIV